MRGINRLLQEIYGKRHEDRARGVLDKGETDKDDVHQSGRESTVHDLNESIIT